MAVFPTLPLTVVVLCCLLPFLTVSQGSSLVEVLYVSGCTDSPTPRRETMGCFHNNSANSIALTVYCNNLPAHMNFRVILAEHSAPHLHTGVRARGGLQLECGDAKASSVLPSQIITCSLPHPHHQLAASDGKDEGEAQQVLRQRLAKAPVWMDVLVEAAPRGSDGAQMDTIGILRNAVQIDATSQVANITSEGNNTTNSSAGILNSAALDRLYSSSTGANASDAMEEVWLGLGVGGLRTELHTLYRRVFLTRLPSVAPITTALGMQHVRGVILYGPPGNGKTLIARSLVRLIGSDARLTIVNAADILSKYVGESEKNIRDVFEGYTLGRSSDDSDGESQKASPPPPRRGLHVLVIDEFESLFRNRGKGDDESSARTLYDGVTNTLLSLMDGLQPRNDLLVIGMTNRVNSIDNALLRPGRFEVVIEIPAPDVDGREDIFFIHTDKLRSGGYLAPDVDLRSLAELSTGFSGSDIAGTVRSAVSYALLAYRGSAAARVVPCGSNSMGVPEPTNAAASMCAGDVVPTHTPATFQVTAQHMKMAIADIRRSNRETGVVTTLPLISANVSATADKPHARLADYQKTLERDSLRVHTLADSVIRSPRLFGALVQIVGGSGAGKTAVARWMAQRAPAHYRNVRIVNCEKVSRLLRQVDMVEELREVLRETSRQGSGVLVLDDVDVLMNQLDDHAPTVRRMIHDYVYKPTGLSTSSKKESQQDFGPNTGVHVHTASASAARKQAPKRLLFLTSTSLAALHHISYDIHVQLDPVPRSGVPELLTKHYGLIPAGHPWTQKVARCYPPSLYYRDFLRITDMALSQTAALNASDTSQTPSHASVASDGVSFDHEVLSGEHLVDEPDGVNIAMSWFPLKTEKEVEQFAQIVCTTVEHMGLSNPFDDRTLPFKRMQSVLEEIVGDGEELLW